MNAQTEQHIEQYLDRLCAQLTQLPAEKQDEVRQETRAHLAALIAAQEASAITASDAITTALQQFGDPASIGRKIAAECRLDAVHEKQAMWAIRLCVVAIVPWAVYSILMALSTVGRYFFFEKKGLLEPLYGYIYPTAFILVCLFALLICWRAYHLRLWACAVLAAQGVLQTCYLLASLYYLHHYSVAASPSSTYQTTIGFIQSGLFSLAFLPTAIMPILLLRWRRLKLQM